MNSDERTKVLFLTEAEYQPECFSNYVNHINNPEDMIILNSNGREVLHPFGEIMRNIIITVYQEKIKEVYIVGDKGIDTSRLDRCTCPSVPQDKLETLEYLFKNCKPEFLGMNLQEWLEGNKSATDFVQKNAGTIRKHPLVPDDVIVRGLFINTGTEEMVEEMVF